MIVAKKVSFDAAHFLPNYEGKCKSMHGHHWTVEVAVVGPMDPSTGMVVDFTTLKDFLIKQVVDKFDHKLLNDIVKNPTAENICHRIYESWNIWKKDKKAIYNETLPELEWVKVWETENSMVEYKGG